MKELGKQNAKIITAEELTRTQESVKQEFRTLIADYKSKISEQLTVKVENLKAELAKNNISYQISLAELTKMRFQKIEELVLDLIKLQDFIRENMFWAENEEDFRKNKSSFNELYKKADISRKLCTLYLPDELIQKIIDVLNNSHSAYMSFVKMYHTNPKQLGEVSLWDLNAHKIQQDLTNENFKAYQKLDSEIDKFPSILKDLSSEFKKQVILKNIDE
ncbi:hypothetical protein DIT68_14415 [Brumimicrobium oceani]|uniref:Uncharacterized protein n=2 Tax=Brumimicrobium oceani TaxID=2100725 RepID=A0A2U2X275_9FLAO|nr:hypothetical protein DIT68_14415 [Brumimicrobium oceani]